MIANVLSIAGTDPSGGAGIQADIKAISAMGAYACSAVTAVVAQNTQAVRAVRAMDPGFVAAQIDAVFEDVRIDAVKIGMIAHAGIAEAVAERLHRHAAANIVLDPVMVAKSGQALLEPDAVAVVRERLIPRARVITPNLPEASVLLGWTGDWTPTAMREALPALRAMGSDWVLLKGGHLEDSELSTDLLAGPEGTMALAAPRLVTRNGHGTGCTLSAAIAALLPHHPVPEAVRRAKAYLHRALATSEMLDVGQGVGPVHHFHALWSATGAFDPMA